jgi:Ca-activated chloride channel homolog
MTRRTLLLLLLFAVGQSCVFLPNTRGQQAPPANTEKPKPQSGVDPALLEPASPDETLTVTTSLVNVPVQVMDRDGRFVVNLQQDDFRLFENDVPQQIAFFNSVETPFTVVLLIDTSASTRPYQKEIRKAAVSFLDQLRPQDIVMVVAFDGSLRVISKKPKDRQELRKAVDHLSWIGSGTLLYGSVELLLTRFFNRIRGRKALVVLTDGYDADARANQELIKDLTQNGGTVSLNGFPPCDLIPCVTAEQGLHHAEEADAMIYSIQFSKLFVDDCQNIPKEDKGEIKWNCVAQNYLKGLADKTGGRFFHASDPNEFESLFTSIAQELRYQYNLAYYPPNDLTRERRAIKVTVSRENVAVRARKSYIPKAK